MSNFVKLMQKDAQAYKRTVLLLKKTPSPLAKALAWLLLHFSNPHGPVAAAARRYEFEGDD